MVRSEVYLNKYYVDSIAPLSTTACPDYSQNIHKTAFFACSRFLIFHPFFHGWGSVDPICPYVRTPVIHGINFFSLRVSNQFRFDRIMVTSLWPHFFGPPCTVDR